MQNSLNIPWHRYGLIAELAQRMEDKNPQFGKTALQKMVYLLQEVFGIDCGYQFELYTYGPFTSQLLADLDGAEAVGGVAVYAGQSGYRICPGKGIKLILDKAGNFLQDEKVKQALDQLVAGFGGYSAKDLELRATLVYVQRQLARSKSPADAGKLASIVKSIKPKFSMEEISEVIAEMTTQGYLTA